MSESTRVEAPATFDVVPVDVAHALMDDVRSSLAVLEAELERARSEADHAERQSGGDRFANVADDLLRMAEALRSDAEAYAARILAEARARAALLATGDVPTPPRLRLADPVADA